MVMLIIATSYAFSFLQFTSRGIVNAMISMVDKTRFIVSLF